MEAILKEIKRYKNKINQIPYTDTLDDIKEFEHYDSEIVDLIYRYCVSKNYNTDSFPEKYMELIENEDEDFEDFLSFDVKHYYTLKIAVFQKDVFELVKAYFDNSESNDYTDEACMEDIRFSISELEAEKTSLVFNRDDYQTDIFNSPRPKLP